MENNEKKGYMHTKAIIPKLYLKKSPCWHLLIFSKQISAKVLLSYLEVRVPMVLKHKVTVLPVVLNGTQLTLHFQFLTCHLHIKKNKKKNSKAHHT